MGVVGGSNALSMLSVDLARLHLHAVSCTNTCRKSRALQCGMLF